jgi:hypothetical protein
VFDPTLAPPGKHIVSMFSQWVPRTYADEPDDAELAAYADRLVARMDAVAPGFTDSIVGRQVIGPHTMQSEYGLVGGTIFHGELTPGRCSTAGRRPATRTRVPGERPVPGGFRHPRRRRVIGVPGETWSGRSCATNAAGTDDAGSIAVNTRHTAVQSAAAPLGGNRDGPPSEAPAESGTPPPWYDAAA